MNQPEGNAIIYCEGAFHTPNGKTAHGLVRFSRRYRVLAVVDSRYAGQDTGLVLDNRSNGIALFKNVQEAVSAFRGGDLRATHLVVGLAPDGGRLSALAREHIKQSLALGLNVVCGLHDFLSEDPEMVKLAGQYGMRLQDVRRPPDRKDLHFFSGKIETVDCLKIAILGTDSAIGKRTTAWLLVQALEAAGYRSELIGTGQTAWMQGARYSLIMDSLVNDFVSGEIEHAVWSAWKEQRPDAIVIEGQGSLMNPAYPGGFEILAAGRPDLVVLQHAPARRDYDGFPGYPIHPLPRQIQAIGIISDKPVKAITINHEHIPPDRIDETCRELQAAVNLPVVDALRDGAGYLVAVLEPLIKTDRGRNRPSPE